MNEAEVVEQLLRTNDLLAVLVKASLREVITAELKDPKRRKLYELTDGNATVKQLAEQVGLSTGTISTTWQSWEQSGLIVKRNGKYRRVIE